MARLRSASQPSDPRGPNLLAEGYICPPLLTLCVCQETSELGKREAGLTLGVTFKFRHINEFYPEGRHESIA